MVSFRCGNNALVRVNYAQTVHFYNQSQSSHLSTDGREVKWMKADIGIDWEEEIVYGKIEGRRFETSFHTDRPVKEVNGIMIYNLRAATTSYFANLSVSTQLPDASVLLGYIDTSHFLGIAATGLYLLLAI